VAEQQKECGAGGKKVLRIGVCQLHTLRAEGERNVLDEFFTPRECGVCVKLF